MNCPHGVRIDRIPCGACVRGEPADVSVRGRVDEAGACGHFAEGYLFKLDPKSHAGATGLEWCPGCGAHRLLGPGRTARNMREPGGWVLPKET
jgi:hypothetical protein